MAGSWSNQAVQTTQVIVDSGTPQSGLFVYNGTPGPGTLAESITAEAGTDPYGNAYVAGAAGYYEDGTVAWNATAGGPDSAATVVNYSDDSPAEQGVAGLFNGSLVLGTGAPIAELAAQVALYCQSATEGQLIVNLVDSSGTSGGMTMQPTPGFLATITPQGMEWQTPTYATDWAAKDNAGAFPGAQLRVDAEDNLVIKGVLHMTLAAGLAAGTYTINSTDLVAPFVPKQSWRLPGGEHTSSANVWKAQVLVEVTTAGQIQLTTSSAIAQGDNFYISWDCPLGNVS